MRDEGRRGRVLAVVAGHGAGVQAGFSLPWAVGPGGVARSGRCCDRPGMLSDGQLADALVAAGAAGDGVRYQRCAPGLAGLAGTDRVVIPQGTGMIAAQLDDTVASALARRRAAASAGGRPVDGRAGDVAERRVRFDE